MAEMRIHANKVKELAVIALLKIETDREGAHREAIAKSAEGHTVGHWWYGSRPAPLSLEKATEIYDNRRLFFDNFTFPSMRSETDKPFDVKKRHVEGLVDLATKALAYSDGFIVLDVADAKVLIPSEVLISG